MLPPTFSWWVRSSEHAAILEEAREVAVHDRRADLRLDVVADDRQARLLEAIAPVLLACDEDRDAVDVRAAGLQGLLDVPLRGGLGADRQVRDEHVRLGRLEDADDVVGLARRLLDDLAQVLAEAVVRHAAMHRHPEVRHVGELDRVVLTRPDGLRQILADLLLVDVERRDELDVADVVAAEVDVHQAGDDVVPGSIAVVVHALDERAGAVADADDRDAHLAVVEVAAVEARSSVLAHGVDPFSADAETSWRCTE